MVANANTHFNPKVLSFLQDTSSIVPHRDSGSARALEKSGDLGKHNVRMYVQLRMTMWTLLTLRGNMCGRSSIATNKLPASQQSKLLTGFRDRSQ